MIAKVSRGDDGPGLVRYLFSDGRSDEHTHQRVLATSEGIDVRHGVLLTGAEISDLARQLDGPHALFGTEVKDGHIWHLSLTNPAEDRHLSDEEWSTAVGNTMSRLGFSEGPGRAGCPWVAVHHGVSTGDNDHVHVAVSLVREDGAKASIWQDRVKLSKACADFERNYGLTVVDGRHRQGLPGVSRAETELADRRGRPEPERETLARQVRAASVAARDEAEFVRRLRAEDIVCRPRYASGGREEVVGYSVALRPRAGQDPVWYGGGRLAKDLVLPKLRAHWDRSSAAIDDAVAAWSTRRGGSGREAVAKGPAAWGNAADRVDLIGRHLADVPTSDTARWSGAAREAAGVFAQLAARLEPDTPGPLAAAAEVLARSAQPYRQDPGVVRDGPVRDLRGVAGVIGQAQLQSGSGPEVARLLSGLSGTVNRIASAHTARGEPLQARQLGRAAANVSALGAQMIAAERIMPTDRLVSKLIGEEANRAHGADDAQFRLRHRIDYGRENSDKGFSR